MSKMFPLFERGRTIDLYSVIPKTSKSKMSIPVQAIAKSVWVKLGSRSVYLVTIKSPLLVRTDGSEKRVWVTWTRTLCQGKALTFPDSMLHRNLCKCWNVFLFFHSVPPTIYHRISNGTWGQIIVSIQVETHTGHDQYNNGNDDVQS